MRKYLVITYNDDQQETYYDRVRAMSEEGALKRICDIRDYALPVCALTPVDLTTMADLLSAMSGNDFTAELASLKEADGQR